VLGEQKTRRDTAARHPPPSDVGCEGHRSSQDSEAYPPLPAEQKKRHTHKEDGENEGEKQRRQRYHVHAQRQSPMWKVQK